MEKVVPGKRVSVPAESTLRAFISGKSWPLCPSQYWFRRYPLSHVSTPPHKVSLRSVNKLSALYFLTLCFSGLIQSLITLGTLHLVGCFRCNWMIFSPCIRREKEECTKAISIWYYNWLKIKISVTDVMYIQLISKSVSGVFSLSKIIS